MKDLMVLEGKEAMFRCEPESLPNEVPPTSPLWKKNGVDLEIDGGCIFYLLKHVEYFYKGLLIKKSHFNTSSDI